ncbi:serine hydrolase [Streptomyces agglomeratus]|uniref:serine hydrolase n=1 Tax=Streptomyces agglomeratus TaxID=285458 RepID=UPI000ADA9C37|nr:serine hydrolase [Streptomyces agglomeratus]
MPGRGRRSRSYAAQQHQRHPDYIPTRSLLCRTSPKSLDDNRFRQFRPAELIETRLPPGARSHSGVYSNTNYLLLGQLLEQVTGTAESTSPNVIERAGLRHTGFPAGPHRGTASRCTSLGLIDPRATTASTTCPGRDGGRSRIDHGGSQPLLRQAARRQDRQPASLAQMQRTVPVVALDGSMIEYGLGLHKVAVRDCGTFWGHDGTVWGAGTMSLTRADGERQMSVALNLQRWNKPDSSGKPQHHPIDAALKSLYRQAMCGDANAQAENAS